MSEYNWYGCNYISNTEENIWRNINYIWTECKRTMTSAMSANKANNRKLRMTVLIDFYGTVNNFTNTPERCDRSIGLPDFQVNPLLVMTLQSLCTYCPCLYSSVESFTIILAREKGLVQLQLAIKMNSTSSLSPPLQTILTPNRTHKMLSYELVASYIFS